MTKSLKSLQSPLTGAEYQLKLLNSQPLVYPKFEDSLAKHDLHPVKANGVKILQLNLGKMCNQACKHCHVDAGPDRKEIMTQETMLLCLQAVDALKVSIVDLTGGAPEMNPHFRWLVTELTRRGVHVMVRCNLTIILANKKYNDLPAFFAEHKVEVVSSLPFYSTKRTDKQRGDGVFGKSIKALSILNEQGYGKKGSGLMLNLVYNPSGAFLPDRQELLETEFRRQLSRRYQLEFNNLYAITNMPISRFLDYLVQSGNYDEYMQQLIDAFNPEAVDGLMCRDTVSVSWDGYLYDCDFNQMLEINIKGINKEPMHIGKLDAECLAKRSIAVNQHCYGCTAGAGSSCGGETL